MSTKAFEYAGAKFVTNNYAAILSNAEAPNEFHLIQDYLAHSEFMYALTQPEVISPAQVLTLWRSARYNDGGEHGSYEGQEYLVTPETVRKALHLPEHSKYHSSVSTQTLKDMMQFFGYSGNTDKMGELKRPCLCKEWSFYYDCITRAFGNKCSNFDAIPLFSQHIGYALIHNLNFDIAPSILRFIGDRKLEDENTVYFARFCQLIFSYCYPLVPIPDTDTELPFKITKRAFTDLIKKDSKKPQLPVFAIPVTVQDKLKLTMPDKYDSLFSDENIPSSSHQAQDIPTSGPSQKGPVVKSDLKTTSGPSQKGPVVTSSPTRVLRSSKSPSKQPSPPPRKRRFLQRLSDSDSDPEPEPVPLISRPRKKIKPTSTITDLTVDPPQESIVNPLEMVTVSDPLMVEPLSAVPLTTSSEADIPMSEHIPQSEDLLPHSTAAAIPPSENTPEEHVSTPEAHVTTPEAIVSTPEAIVTTPDIAQEILTPVEDLVAAPDQEMLYAANSEEATAPLCSQTLSIAVDDDDDDADATEVTSVPPIDSAILVAEISAQIRESISVREVSPVRDPSPVKPASPAPACDIPPSKPTENRVCTLSYSKRMHRAPTSSVEARLSSIESTQRSMQQTLAELSSSVAQLSQSKEKRSDKAGSSSHQSQKTKSQPLIPADSKTRALSEQLIKLGNPESKILSHTVKIQGEETTFFYKAPTQLAFDEAVAKNLFEEENPGVSLEDARKEEERLAAENKKIRKSKSDEKEAEIDQKKVSSDGKKLKKSDSDSSEKGKKIIDGVPSKRKAESEVKQTLAIIPQSTDQSLASDIAQAKDVKKEKLKPVEDKATWIKSTSDKAQVDTAEPKKKSFFGSLGTGQYKESSLFTQIRAKGTRGKRQETLQV
nr:PREDICTED: proteoglycan 4-like [Daucus carota subsp. sativus]